jgi:hypothetical protein
MSELDYSVRADPRALGLPFKFTPNTTFREVIRAFVARYPDMAIKEDPAMIIVSIAPVKKALDDKIGPHPHNTQ